MPDTPSLPLIEPVLIEDDLCTGLAIIEPVWAGARLVFFAEQTSYESRSLTWVVKRKIVLPLEAIETLALNAVCHIQRQGHTLRRRR